MTQWAADQTKSNPPAVLAGLGYSRHGDGKSCVSHRQVLFLGELEDIVEGRGHLDIELPEDLVLLPVIIHIALDLFEVAAGDSPGVGQDVRDDEDAPLADRPVGVDGGRTIGPFSDDPDAPMDKLHILL